MSKIIALDCDGVLLDYNKAYPKAWFNAFGEVLERKNPGMFFAYNEYDCAFKNRAQKDEFYDCQGMDFWSNMEPLDGALDACFDLVYMGYELICVTSMPDRFLQPRIKNLNHLGFPISKTFATGRDRSITTPYNPKREVLLDINPLAFVDDHADNFLDLPGSGIHLALIDRNQPDSPNKDLMVHTNSVHNNLSDFVSFWKTLN